MRGKVFFSVEGYKVTFTEVLNHEAQGFVEYVSTYMENR